MDCIPEDEVKSKPASILLGLKLFRENAVRWAKVSGNAYIALEEGSAQGAWMAIIPPDHEAIENMRSTLELDSNPDLIMLRIKPEKMTHLWAGIFLVHELSHLADRAYKIESAYPTREEFLLGELRAYNLELIAANFCSKKLLRHRLISLLDKWKPETAYQITDYVRNINNTDLAFLDSAVPAGPPQSINEQSLRLGFYTLALILQYAEIEKYTLEEVFAVMGSFYPKSSEF